MRSSAHDVLLVIDVQNDFCPGGALPVSRGDEVIAPILRMAARFEHIVLTQDWHPAGHSSFAANHAGKRPYEQVAVRYGLEYASQTLWPVHCVQGTRGAEFHPDLRLPQAELIVRKGFRPEIDSYSAFFENDHATPTGLAGYLKERELNRVFLAGLAYDFCVGYSALDARRVGLPALVVRDACRAIDLRGPDSESSVSAMEALFQRAGVGVIDSQELCG